MKPQRMGGVSFMHVQPLGGRDLLPPLASAACASRSSDSVREALSALSFNPAAIS